MDETRVKALIEEASERYNDGRYDEAIGRWREALALDPANQKAKEGIRMASLLVVDWEEPAPAAGEETAEEAAVDSKNLHASIEAGVSRVQELVAGGRLSEALEGCALLEEIAPGMDEVLRLSEEVRQAASRRGIRPAGAAQPPDDQAGDIEHQMEKARKALAEGHDQAAAAAATRALEIDPSNMEACGILSLVGGDTTLPGVSGIVGTPDLPAQEEEPEGVTLPPRKEMGRIEALLEEGETAFAAGRPETAIEIWSRIFAIDQSNAEAGARIDRGKAALEEKARQLDELYFKAVDAQNQGRTEEALQVFRQLLEVSPNHPEATACIEEITNRQKEAARPIEMNLEMVKEVTSGRSSGADEGKGDPFDGSSVPLADFEPHDAVSPALPARARPQKPWAGKGAGSGRGWKRQVAAAACLVLLAAIGTAAYLWFGSETGSMPEAQATPLPAAPKPPRPAPAAPAARTVASAPLEVVPGSTPKAPPPAPSPEEAEDQREEAAGFERQGRGSYQQKRWADAVISFRKALAVDPVEFGSQEMLDKAMASLENQARFEREMDAANKAFAEGDYATALQKFYRLQQDYVEANDLDAYIKNSWFDWGVALLQEGAVDEAAEKFTEVLDIDRQDREASRAREMAQHYHRKQADKVLLSFAAALRLRPLDQP
jgi:tetratricopeptide (TPR) repeat protein